MADIRIALAGIGNCASSLLQGLEYYSREAPEHFAGLLFCKLAGYSLSDIQVVAAFDVDHRKVGQPLEKAAFALPNNTVIFQKDLPSYGVIVEMGPVLDGVAEHMKSAPEKRSFRVAHREPVDVVRVLKKSGSEILVCYLPVGSENAVQHYARACLEAGVAMVNCIPVFIASNPVWANEFRKRNLPVVGDDIKSQVGATIIHRALASLIETRGARLERTYQLNVGGNTDFLNMLESGRIRSKQISKLEALQSQLTFPLPPEDIHIGPSDYVAWQEDTKVCFLRIEWRGWGDIPMNLELRLSVEDSPNSAAMVIDAIRCTKLALDRGIGGPLFAVSAYAMKHPPKQLRDADARRQMDAFIAGEFDTT